MAATSHPNATDYMDPGHAVSMVTVDADFQRDYELHERAVYIRECRMYLLNRVGLVPGKYWRGGKPFTIGGPQQRPRRMGFFAGFCGRARGRHWDRKR